MHTGTQTCPSTRGLSLIEIMIVVTILGIIGAIALPMFSGSNAARLRAAASVLAADIEAARAESMAHSEDLRMIVFNTNNQGWHIAPTSDPTTPINNPDSNQPYQRAFGLCTLRQLQGVTIQSYTLDTDTESSDNKLGFGLYGQLDQTTNATITLACGDRTTTLNVHP